MFKRFFNSNPTSNFEKASFSDDPEQKAQALANLGASYLSMGEIRQAGSHLEKALKILRPLPTLTARAIESSTFIFMAELCKAQKEPMQAITYALLALEKSGESHNNFVHGQALAYTGSLLAEVERFPEAARNYNLALAALRASYTTEPANREQAQARELRTLCTLGACFALMNNFEQAIESYKQATRLALKLNNQDVSNECQAALSRLARTTNQPIIVTLENLGFASLFEQTVSPPTQNGTNTGLPPIKHLKKVLVTARRGSNRQAELDAVANIASAYYKQKQYDTARQYFDQALKIAQQLNNKRDEATLSGWIGSTYDHQQQYETAITYSERALDLARQIGDLEQEGDALRYLCFRTRTAKLYPQAIKYYKQSLTFARTHGDMRKTINAHVNLGVVYSEGGDYYHALGELLTMQRVLNENIENHPFIDQLNNEILPKIEATVGPTQYQQLKVQVEADLKAGLLPEPI